MRHGRGSAREGCVRAMAAAKIRSGLTSLMKGELGLEVGEGWSSLLRNWWFTVGDGFINIIFMRWNKSNIGA